jgi:hypothetical protein
MLTHMSMLELAGALRDGIGASDCEFLRDEALAQPVNALTSFAYVVVGLLVIARASVSRRPLAAALVYGTCLVGVGLGSVLFHGPQPDGSRVLHDLPILFTVVFIVAYDLSLVSSRVRHPMVLFVIGAGVAMALTIIDPDLGAGATGLAVVGLAALEFIIYRRRLRPAATHRQRQGYITIIVVSAIAGATWLLGRTDSPACDPDAVFQFHGLWHVISAFVFGLWWWLAFDISQVQPTSNDSIDATPVSS